MTEILAVKEGKARVRVDGRDMVLGPGQSVVVRPGQVHQFWNEGEGRLVLMTEDRPPGRHRAMFELMHRLDCAGKTNKQRIPTNPLLLALLMERTDAYLPGLPVMLQKLIFGSLTGLARLVGYEYKWAREPGDPVRVRRSAVVEASAIVPLGPEETWDMLLGEQIPRLVEMPGMSVVAVEDYRMRPDGTPRYTMANKVGPVTVRHTADFSVYERPHRSVTCPRQPLRWHSLRNLRARVRGYAGEVAVGGRTTEPARRCADAHSAPAPGAIDAARPGSSR